MIQSLEGSHHKYIVSRARTRVSVPVLQSNPRFTSVLRSQSSGRQAYKCTPIRPHAHVHNTHTYHIHALHTNTDECWVSSSCFTFRPSLRIASSACPFSQSTSLDPGSARGRQFGVPRVHQSLLCGGVLDEELHLVGSSQHTRLLELPHEGSGCVQLELAVPLERAGPHQ